MKYKMKQYGNWIIRADIKKNEEGKIENIDFGAMINEKEEDAYIFTREEVDFIRKDNDEIKIYQI